MEWPELLARCSEALRQYATWVEGGCVGPPPASVDASGVQGPLPQELRARAAQIATQTAHMEASITGRLAQLKSQAGHTAPVRQRYGSRPLPIYLDAMG